MSDAAPTVSGAEFDYVLVGGGLANGLAALALLGRNPAPRVALIEQGSALGGNHTWSFHESDLGTTELRLVAPLVRRSWSSHDVCFPSGIRRIAGGYASCDSSRLDGALKRSFAEAPGSELILEKRVLAVRETGVRLDDGKVVLGRVVLDGRGLAPADLPAVHRGGYQKFVGLELELDRPCPSAVPVLMDARVEQIDGYRFMYVLPFSEKRVLVEDTYYSLSPTLERGLVQRRVLQFAEARGYRVRTVVREEHGVLPLPTHASKALDTTAIAVGMRAGWFHPTTGYSLPMAARFAIRCAEAAIEQVPQVARDFAREHERGAQFPRFLNRLLFSAFAPHDRRNVLQRFYGLPEEVVARFYAMESTALDRARILCGRPPIGFSIFQMLAGERTV